MEVWHVRHGERCDKVGHDHLEGKGWRRSASYRRGRRYDPPLTQLGHTQACRAGSYLRSLPFNQGPDRNQSGFDRMYTSPLMRALETAVCISQQFGGLPLQVVSGLCSCTAVIKRIGFANAVLMSDADIANKFPDIELLPRDPTAPTSFRGAVDWLISRPSRRILCVGHREGTIRMAGRSVPTPYCCVGIFRVNCNKRRRYELVGLMSNIGTKLELRGSASAMKLPNKVNNGVRNGNGRGDLDAATDRMTALKITANDKLNGGSVLMRRYVSGSDGVKKRPIDSARRRTSTKPIFFTNRHSRNSNKHNLLEESPGLGFHDSTKKTVSKRVNGVCVYGPKLERRDWPKADSGDASTTNYSCAESRGGEVRLASAVFCSMAVAPKPPKNYSHIDIAEKCKDHAARGAGACVKPAAHYSCAGRGFRVAQLARQPLRDIVSPTLLGVPQDALCGPSGVLSFLWPLELCVAQATCKTMATAATDNALWLEMVGRLPRHLRDKYTPSFVQDVEQPRKNDRTFKAIFSCVVSAALCARAERSEKKYRAWRIRLGPIHSQRGLLNALKATLAVSLAGTRVAIVDSCRPRPGAWTHHMNILSKPSVRSGLRIFTLSSSIKLKLPESHFATSQLRSIHVACSLPETWLPRTTVFQSDGLLLSQARLLGKSGDNAVALYDVVQRSDDRGKQNSDTVLPPTPRACALLGILEGNHKNEKDDPDSVGFLTVHCPHELLLRAATRRPPGRHPRGRLRDQLYGDDPAGAKHGLEKFTFALGLRTSGVPMWETARMDVDGRLCARWAGSQSERNQDTEGQTVVRVDLLRHNENTVGQESTALDAERRVCEAPGIPYCTSSGLSGIIEDVFIADFIAIDTHDRTIWSFASPMVFGALPTESERVIADEDFDGFVNMRHREVREERKQGVVHEPGVGRVIIDLALMECDETSEPKQSVGRQRYPVGHMWSVRAARVELELGFINALFGTKHGHPLS